MAQAAVARTYDDDEVAAGAASKAASLPAGTVLASRYRLEELLAESAPTVTWRAVRPGAVPLGAGPPAGARATERRGRPADRRPQGLGRHRLPLPAGARRGAQRRSRSSSSYIVCEYATGQSLEMILSHGPLSGLEAAWVVREVADALAGVHGLGLYHRRINPDTVIITPTGNVKIVGLLIEAALRPTAARDRARRRHPGAGRRDRSRPPALRLAGRPAGRVDRPSACRTRRSLGHRWMTPRQVRAGVSPALDNVCDQILGDPPRHRARRSPPRTAWSTR